jgi:hypothetical protein
MWIGAALVVALALAVWFLRNPAAEDAAQKGAAGASATAHAGAAPAPTPGAVAPPSAKAGLPAGNGNGNGNGNEAGAKPRKDPRLDAQERAFISRFFELPGPNATQQERDFWEQSPVADLLYPQGHPCAGQPLDSTSPAVLAQAGKEALAKSIDSIPDVDTPQCVYQGNWPFFPLNQACSSVVPEDPVSVAHCTDFLLNMQQDPSAYPATIWLPCSMGQQPTTRRAFYEGLIADEVQRVFSGPPCTVR